MCIYVLIFNILKKQRYLIVFGVFHLFNNIRAMFVYIEMKIGISWLYFYKFLQFFNFKNRT